MVVSMALADMSGAVVGASEEEGSEVHAAKDADSSNKERRRAAFIRRKC
jgi:hypothetical protein